MASHPERELWALAEGALDEPARAAVEAHVAGCARCAEALAATRVARETLALARQAPGPAVDWARVTRGINASAHLAEPVRWTRWVVGALAAATAVLALWVLWRGPSPGAAAPPAQIAVAPAAPAAVPVVVPVAAPEPPRAIVQSAALASSEPGSSLGVGAQLGPGSAIRTQRAGTARVRLADASELLVLGGSDVALEAVSSDDVVLGVRSGAVAIQASHAPRREFRVEAGGASVRVVGTVFTVSVSPGRTIVAVAEGAVQVDWARGEGSRRVAAGQKLVFEDGAVRMDSLGDRERRAFAALAGEEIHKSPPPKVAPVPEPVSAQPAAAPAAVESAAVEPAAAPAGPAIAPVTPGSEAAAAGELLVEQPTALAPAPPEDQPESQADSGTGWEEVPPDDAPADDAAFLAAADAARGKAACTEMLDRLGHIAVDDMDKFKRGHARILRARCFAERGEWDRAMAEYWSYLQAFPAGPYSGEAERAVQR